MRAGESGCFSIGGAFVHIWVFGFAAYSYTYVDVRLSTFNEFLLPPYTKALRCLESDNAGNSRVAGCCIFIKNTGNVFQSHRYVRATGTVQVFVAYLPVAPQPSEASPSRAKRAPAERSLPVKKIDGLEKTDGLDLWGKAHDRFETGLSKRFRLLLLLKPL
jgi:hypothetical protein